MDTVNRPPSPPPDGSGDVTSNAVSDADRAVACILFDLDGTLADTAPDMVNALNAVLAAEGRAPLALAAVRDYVSHGSGYLLRMAFGADQPEAQYRRRMEQFLNHYRAHLCEETRLFPGMTELLAHFESREVAWGVVTNKPGWLTDPLMELLGVANRAACIVSGDTTAERKPHPLPMFHAAQLAGAAPSACLYVGDAERDILAGRAAGMRTLIAAYGYIDASQQPHEWGADGAISGVMEILNWLPARIA